MEFSNQQIEERLLPSVLDIKYRAIERKHRTVSIIASTIFTFVILVIPFLINMASGDTWFYDHMIYILGPIERMFGLSKLKIFTAGGASSDLKIPGLLPETANKLKDYIQLKVGRDEEE